MKFPRHAAAVLGLALLLLVTGAEAAGALGPPALRARHASLAPQLAENAFGGPLVLQSEEAARRIEGDVYAVLDHPFAVVSAALADPAQWCDILILHLNTKYCRRSGDLLEVRVGKKEEQSVNSATLLRFAWRPAVVRPDYLSVEMVAAEGPYDTRDYRLLAEAVPLEDGRTFLHMGYALSYGMASNLALNLYLGTVGRDKVGFTRANGGFVGGQRGVVERNTMRYYLAIDGYLRSLAAPPAERLEQRLKTWFNATEKYPRQLHEVDQADYLRMKRNEVARQSAVNPARP
ncbi:MAG: signal peptide protein [Ramlibacter sp.]|nr:signal peptide protein [Ramlibacter sp.]